ncbi:MAG TPA: VOC family protein [Gaiellaceae bacterium]|jgi:catechol 2,3-dioxygenase-like lactoylglutathione lyase family enzyme|nr:VOC family protein [Gaiellaceae bacterium]
MIVEHVDFISVPVTDMERSTAWYRDTLGLPQTSEGGFPEFKLGDNAFLYLVDPKAIGGVFEGPHTSGVALRVADVAEARSELEAKGIVFEGETYDTGVCHMAIFGDPDGNAFMLHRRYAPHES